MAYSTPYTFTALELVTAAKMNAIQTNIAAIWVGTTAGDVDYYTSSTTKTRVGIGTTYKTLKVNSGATAPEWAVFMEKCIVYKVATQNVTTSSEDTLTWDTEIVDDKGWHSTSVNTDRITVIQDGYYVPTACIRYTTSGGTGTYLTRGKIKVNGAITPNRFEMLNNIDGNEKCITFGGIPMLMTAGQYATATLYHEKGSTATVYGTDASMSMFSLVRIG